MIAIIHDFGGDVVKFAGDAMCIIWPVAEGKQSGPRTLKKAVTLAAECSLEIHRVCLLVVAFTFVPCRGCKFCLGSPRAGAQWLTSVHYC